MYIKSRVILSALSLALAVIGLKKLCSSHFRAPGSLSLVLAFYLQSSSTISYFDYEKASARRCTVGGPNSDLLTQGLPATPLGPLFGTLYVPERSASFTFLKYTPDAQGCSHMLLFIAAAKADKLKCQLDSLLASQFSSLAFALYLPLT